MDDPNLVGKTGSTVHEATRWGLRIEFESGEILHVYDGKWCVDDNIGPDEKREDQDERLVSFDAVMRGCGSSSHHPENTLTPPELEETLSLAHPVVIATLVRRWAEARKTLGGSSAEHPQFRESIQHVLDSYPDGYGEQETVHEPETYGDDDELSSILRDLAKKREDARNTRLEMEPDTSNEANESGYERGLRTAIRMFEENSISVNHPEWQVCLENDDNEGGWYHVTALTREAAINAARAEARDEFGSGSRFEILKLSGSITQ